ncbi:MAG: YlxR family protein [Deferribacteraceae bacterium]|jgi:predicted RNA-binding protein YlxR (DUF448 family)|nr:YlxR family protein [Deferribacteraceae bacterium]
MAQKRSNPERTCIVCRAKRSKVELMRMVRVDNSVVVDHRQVYNGRGCYVCPTCVSGLADGKALRRVFRCNAITFRI